MAGRTYDNMRLLMRSWMFYSMVLAVGVSASYFAYEFTASESSENYAGPEQASGQTPQEYQAYNDPCTRIALNAYDIHRDRQALMARLGACD